MDPCAGLAIQIFSDAARQRYSKSLAGFCYEAPEMFLDSESKKSHRTWSQEGGLGGVLGAPIYPGGAEMYLKVPEPPIYVNMRSLTVLSVLNIESLYTKPPPYDF